MNKSNILDLNHLQKWFEANLVGCLITLVANEDKRLIHTSIVVGSEMTQCF